MKPEFVLSGAVRRGDVGEPTPLIDMTGDKLFVGDIVVSASIDSLGVSYIHGLSVVCSDRWTSYSSGSHVPKDEYSHFIMGLKNIDFTKHNERWFIKRVKSFADVLPGERWPDYGFNYSLSVDQPVIPNP